ncbi:hypothetical protein ACH47B_22460 [Rhodococcus sp. NPDC019627]|uniref:Uncharacterized protein n=1 Tax=Rhodococcus opacus (strain B4) TaxID=632772 RepID=C1BDY8_RHOOB|nr:hypothetical protein [Rhodococcus opacus]BAH47191.1 hypothetical protein ROP_pROB02-01840 [Rhodococcus opacus B4]
MSTRIAVSINLGPNAPIQILSAALSDLNTICALSTDLEKQITRANMLYRFNSEDLWYRLMVDKRFNPPSGWKNLADIEREVYFLSLGPLQDLARNAVEAEISRIINERGWASDGEIYVTSLTYANPLDAVLTAISAAGIRPAGEILYRILVLIRDWKQDRRRKRLSNDDYEDQIQTRKLIRAHVTKQLIEDGVSLSPEIINSLFTDDRTDAFAQLSRAQLSIESTRVEDARDDSSPTEEA